MIISTFPTLCADDLVATRDFYISLFGFKVIFDSDWYVQLQAPTEPLAQIGVVAREHDSVPEQFRHHPAGVLVAIEVDDVDGVYAQAVQQGQELVIDLRSEDWGQRHFMILDPAGTLIDVITPIPPRGEYAGVSEGAAQGATDTSA